MTENSLDKKENTSSESMHHSISGTAQKHWQTPKMTEVDYSETESGLNTPSGDLSGYSS
jgi:hypothetical protein